MNLHKMLVARAEAGRPVKVGLIGAGKFGAMFLTQARRTAGVHLVGIADLDPGRARDVLALTGWDRAASAATDLRQARDGGGTCVLDDAAALIALDGLEVIIEATGDPKSGIRHCRAAIRHGVNVVMVNVEADVVAGPLLAREAQAAGVIYSLAWG
ncbi:MAG: Gfo/Idh/MocA family oxidoreductase, partial [Gammaproteobacteria bacterium]